MLIPYLVWTSALLSSLSFSTQQPEHPLLMQVKSHYSSTQTHPIAFHCCDICKILCNLCAKSLQSCPTLCDPMDCSPTSSSFHRLLQARILEWVAIPFSRGSSWPRIELVSLTSPVLAGGFFTNGGFPDSSVGKESACNAGDHDSWVGKIPWRRGRLPTPVFLGFPCGLAGKESACNVGDLGSIPGLGRSPGEGKGYPLQYSGLENSVDCIAHGVAKSRTWLSDFHVYFLYQLLLSLPHVPSM